MIFLFGLILIEFLIIIFITQLYFHEEPLKIIELFLLCWWSQNTNVPNVNNKIDITLNEMKILFECYSLTLHFWIWLLIKWTAMMYSKIYFSIILQVFNDILHSFHYHEFPITARVVLFVSVSWCILRAFIAYFLYFRFGRLIPFFFYRIHWLPKRKSQTKNSSTSLYRLMACDYFYDWRKNCDLRRAIL